MTVSIQHRIGGQWQDSAAVRDDRNPARPEEVVALVPSGDQATAHAALDAARSALGGWARTPALARGEILYRSAIQLEARAEAIGAELTREEGKTLTEAVGEVRRAAAILRYFAARTAEPIGEVYASAVPGTRITTLRQPVGVVAVITPWNFPIAIPAWKIAPALAYGNAVVFKPATPTPLTAYRLVEAFIDAGLPAGVLNLVFASGESITNAWITSGGVDAVSFTGSEAVGRALQARAVSCNTKVQLELGGKNAVVVAPDADLQRAADLIVRGGYASAGQKCTATSRVIAIGSILDPLRTALAERVGLLLAGNPLEPSTTLAPLIDIAARDRVAKMVVAAEDDGARVVVRGHSPNIGAFHPAILLDQLDPTMRVAQEEVFGPVVGLIAADDLSEAITFHNSVAYGLSGAIFTRDLVTADTFVHAAQAGIIHVNGETAGAEPHVPFGGMRGSSSWSREQGHESEAFYTQTKTVYWEGLPGAALFDG